MAQTDTNSPARAGRRSFWGVLLNNGAYAGVMGVLLATPRRQFWLLASFPLIWILVAHLGPILQMFWISFLDSYPPVVGREPQFTLDNWGRFFGERIFMMPFLRTIVLSFVLTLCTLLLTYPVAYFLAKHVPPRTQLLFLLILLIPFWVGEIVRTYAIMILLGNRGAVNMLLMWTGAIERPIPFMYTNFSLGVGIIYLTSLYMLLPLYSALEKIPNSYREAAADLGAGAWTRFFRITLPLSREGIASGCTLVFLLGGPSTTVFAETVAGFFHVAGDQWPVGAAFSGIMLLTTLALTGIFLKIMGRSGRSLMQ